jgi:hypothetical protein
MGAARQARLKVEPLALDPGEHASRFADHAPPLRAEDRVPAAASEEQAVRWRSSAASMRSTTRLMPLCVRRCSGQILHTEHVLGRLGQVEENFVPHTSDSPAPLHLGLEGR